MGNILSNRVGTVVSETGGSRNHPYVYTGLDGGDYFSTHYHLGPRKFETAEEQQFLFGEMSSLNFLTSPPTAFPYKQLSSKRQPLHCLYSLLNLQRESLQLVRVDSEDSSSQQYNIEFVFDSEIPCKITIYHYLPDSTLVSSLKDSYPSCSTTVVSRSFQFENGLEQKFSHPSVTVSPAEMRKELLVYNPESGQNIFPVCILIETDETEGHRYQSLLTVCNLEEVREGVHVLKVLKQKLLVDGVEYLLQEIYGLENKKTHPQSRQQSPEADSNDDDDDDVDDDDDDDEDLGAECVICFTDVRDTILLPCRHFCLCASCAGDLRYQSSNCPICRFPFRALLQIQAIHSGEPLPTDDDITNNPRLYTEQGHRLVSLLQELNGYPPITDGGSDSPDGCVTETEEEAVTEGEIDSPVQPQQIIQPDSTTVVIPLDGEDEDQDEEEDTLRTIHEVECHPSKSSSKLKNGVHQPIPLPGTPYSSGEDDTSLDTVETMESMLTAAAMASGSPNNRCDSSASSEDRYSSSERLVRITTSSSLPSPHEDGSSLTSSGSVGSSSSHDALLSGGRGRKRDGGGQDVSTV